MSLPYSYTKEDIELLAFCGKRVLQNDVGMASLRDLFMHATSQLRADFRAFLIIEYAPTSNEEGSAVYEVLGSGSFLTLCEEELQLRERRGIVYTGLLERLHPRDALLTPLPSSLWELFGLLPFCMRRLVPSLGSKSDEQKEFGIKKRNGVTNMHSFLSSLSRLCVEKFQLRKYPTVGVGPCRVPRVVCPRHDNVGADSSELVHGLQFKDQLDAHESIVSSGVAVIAYLGRDRRPVLDKCHVCK